DGIRDFHVTGVQTCALPISTVGENTHRLQGLPLPTRGPLWLVRLVSPTVARCGLPAARHPTEGASGRLVYTAPANRCRLQWPVRSEERRVGKECGSGGWRRE